MEDDSSTYEGYGELYRGSLKNNPEQEIKSLRSQTLEYVERFDSKELDEDDRYFMSPDESTQLFTYFTMAAAIIEELSIALLAEGLTDTETGSMKSASEFYGEDLTQYHRQTLLLYSGTIDTGTHGEMEKIRKHRNSIVHSSRERKFVQDIEATKNRINSGVRAIEHLWKKLRDTE